ncbi:MAG: class I SAM-dependent methyltransferase [Candidatus Kuenenia sp.]|nr:class I SAM-dependent methyltransferase [Candidatus Kuenenia hertensis]
MEKNTHDSVQAEYWDKVSSKISNVEMTSLAIKEINDFFVFADLREGMQILEIGAGAGRFTLPLLRMGFKVTATEVSAKSLEELYTSATKENLLDKLILKETTFKEPIFNEEFDLVICGNVIHHFNHLQKKQIMSNIVLALKSGGKIVIFEPNAYHPLYLPWYLFIELSGKNKGIWEVEKGIFKSTLSGIKKILLVNELKDIEIKMHTLIPLRLCKIFYPFVKINEVLENIPIINSFSAFIWVKARKI